MLELNPPALDVSSGPSLLTMTLRITDDLSGTHELKYAFRGPLPEYWRPGSVLLDSYRTSGDELDGTYEVPVEFPQYSPAGTWHLDGLEVSDRVGNVTVLEESDLIAEGFPTEVEVISIPEDTTAPVLTDLDLNPTAIDVSASSQIVNIDLIATDDLSGVHELRWAIQGPSPDYRRLGEVPLDGYRTSGDALNGTYRVPVEFPRYSPAGPWRLNAIDIVDVVGNVVSLDEAYLTGQGFPTVVDVTSDPQDVQSPQLAQLDLDPTTVDVQLADQTVTMTLRVTDDLSGAYELRWAFQGPLLDLWRPGSVVLDSYRASGDDLNGVYEIPVEFPRYLKTGAWHLDGVMLLDTVGNGIVLQEPDLAGMGFPTVVDVTWGESPPIPIPGSNVWSALSAFALLMGIGVLILHRTERSRTQGSVAIPT